MASDVSGISINYEEEGVLLVKELDRQVLSKGAWATIIFKFEQWDANKNIYGPPRFTIRRYRKINDEYKQQAKFNISSVDQATKIVAALQKWIAEVGGASGASDEE